MERKVIIEILKLYKDFRYLWNPRDALYMNKEAKDKAYDILLEKYKQIDENATLRDLRNKIDNMRSTFRREHKKVIASELRGDDDESKHKPHLWYYQYMTFLIEVCNFNLDQSQVEESAPQIRKRKKSSPFSSVFLSSKTEEDAHSSEYNAEYLEDVQELEDTHYFVNEDEASKEESKDESNQLKAFANVIGMQLKDAEPKQRFIAEKLISDVVFLARMNKLTLNSVVLPNPE